MKPSKFFRLIVPTVVISLVASAPAWPQGMNKSMKPMDDTVSTGEMKGTGGMAMKMPADAPAIPPVTGYSDGQDILFIHTETSDPKIAKILTDMMGGSPVLVVPALAKAPKELLAPVYVFTNGKTGGGPTGPLGGQADIFEHPPGGAGYRPLRAVTLVTWNDEKSARVLKSVVELKRAVEKGEVSTARSGVVVNMPFLKWPGGGR